MASKAKPVTIMNPDGGKNATPKKSYASISAAARGEHVPYMTISHWLRTGRARLGWTDGLGK